MKLLISTLMILVNTFAISAQPFEQEIQAGQKFNQEGFNLYQLIRNDLRYDDTFVIDYHIPLKWHLIYGVSLQCYSVKSSPENEVQAKLLIDNYRQRIDCLMQARQFRKGLAEYPPEPNSITCFISYVTIQGKESILISRITYQRGRYHWRKFPEQTPYSPFMMANFDLYRPNYENY